MIHSSAFVHAKAFVDGAAVRIGARTKVWQFASVIRGTILGEDCNVASNVTLDGPHFGDRCVVCPGVDMGPGFIIEDDVFIGPNVVICNDNWPRVAKDGFDAEQLRNGFVTVRLCRGASIGANAVVLPGIVIGPHAMVAAGAVVERNVPADMLLRRDGTLTRIKQSAMERMRPCSTS